MATASTPAPLYNPNDPDKGNEIDRANAANFKKEYTGFDPSPLAKGRGKGAWVIALERKVIALHTAMKAMQPPPCVVVNMNPFPLRVNGTLFDDLVVPACPPQYDFITYEIPAYKFCTGDEGDLKFSLTPVPPMALAYEFEREFGGEECQGGVFYYPGKLSIHLPDQPGKFNPAIASTVVTRLASSAGDLEDVTIGDLYQRALGKMRAYCLKLVNEANNEFNKPNGQRNIVTQAHRRAAVVAVNHGWIADAPSWVNRTKEEARYGEKCPGCRAQLEVDQVRCSKCLHVIDVEKAFELGMIHSDDPAMRRLGAEKLLDMGFDHDQIKYLIPSYEPAEKQPRKQQPKAKKEKPEAEGEGEK